MGEGAGGELTGLGGLLWLLVETVDVSLEEVDDGAVGTLVMGFGDGLQGFFRLLMVEVDDGY